MAISMCGFFGSIPAYDYFELFITVHQHKYPLYYYVFSVHMCSVWPAMALVLHPRNNGITRFRYLQQCNFTWIAILTDRAMIEKKSANI